MVAEMGTADHGACRDRSNHWMPVHIIRRPVMALPALTGSIIVLPFKAGQSYGFPHSPATTEKRGTKAARFLHGTMEPSCGRRGFYPAQPARRRRMSVELIVTGVALASACILLAHAIEAYRAH